MAALEIRVTRITRAPTLGHILEIGGDDWSQTEDSVIDFIERDLCRYYVESGNERLAVRIARQKGRKYLTTEA